MNAFYLNHYLVPNWPAPTRIKAFTTTRQGGHSPTPYASFNFGEAVGDDLANVNANREQLMAELHCPEPFWLTQVHGCDTVCVDEIPKSRQADAAYATQPRKLCAVTTADCLPILVCHPALPIVAAIHAGWKGLAAGVIAASFNALPKPLSDYLVWLGPGISSKHFEVQRDVLNLFCTHDQELEQFFVPQQEGKWLGDLYAIAKTQLRRLGVDQIFGGEYCTVAQPDLFYSARRDKPGGRMATLIWSE